VPLLGAVPDVATVATSTYYETTAAGSTAATAFLEEALRTVCDTSVATGSPIYKYAASGTNLYLCARAATFTSVTNPYLVIQKAEGGSIQGITSAQGAGLTPVNPTYLDLASLSTATGCGAAVNSISTCTGHVATTKVVASELSFSDVEPDLFKSALNGSYTGASPSAAPVATQVFGVVVNTKLRNALQAQQLAVGTLVAPCTVGDETEACMPSLSSAQLASIFATGHTQNWLQLKHGAGATQTLYSAAAAADLPAAGKAAIHVCTRTAGSGTWALFNAKFQNAPCNGGIDQAIQSASAQTIGTESGLNKVVHSMKGSGDVENCLQDLNDGAKVSATSTFVTAGAYPFVGARWAIGVMGTDRNASGSLKYRFIKIDGYAPSLKNVADGKYKYWGELVNVGTGSGDLTAQALLLTMQDPAKIANLDLNGTWGSLTGFMGTALNPVLANQASASATFDPLKPVNPYTHEVGAGGSLNHCRVPSVPGTSAKAITFN
jgi:hypothetical protein